MKFYFEQNYGLTSESLPAGGAWIEIARKSQIPTEKKSRSPQGERGLKYYSNRPLVLPNKVAPRRGSVD